MPAFAGMTSRQDMKHSRRTVHREVVYLPAPQVPGTSAPFAALQESSKVPGTWRRIG